MSFASVDHNSHHWSFMSYDRPMHSIETAEAELRQIVVMERQLAARREALEKLISAYRELSGHTMRLVVEPSSETTAAVPEVQAPDRHATSPLDPLSQKLLIERERQKQDITSYHESVRQFTASRARDLNTRIVESAAEILSDGIPRKTEMILDALKTRGLEPNTVDKKGGLSTLLGRDSRFAPSRKLGWSLLTSPPEEFPMPQS